VIEMVQILQIWT